MTPRPQIQVTTTEIAVGVLLIGFGLVVIAQCHHLHPAEPTVTESGYALDTSEIKIDTCQPMPQCVDPEPPQPPGETNESK